MRHRAGQLPCVRVKPASYNACVRINDTAPDFELPDLNGGIHKLSDYLGQAYMTQLARPTPEKVALEIGTGSGYQSSLLSRIVKKAYSIEIIEPLGTAVGKIYKPIGYGNVETRVGDGFYGWPEVKEGFDIIIVTCAAQYVPPALIEQLKPGGRLIIPIGQPFKKGQVLYIYTKGQQGKVRSKKDVGVYFIPMTGAMEKQPAPPG